MTHVLRSRLPCTDPESGLRPEMGKKWPKNGFWPHQEKGEKWPKNGLKMDFWANFPIFRLFFPFSPVGPKSIFRPFFPISGRRPNLGSVQGNWDRNSCEIGGQVVMPCKKRWKLHGWRSVLLCSLLTHMMTNKNLGSLFRTRFRIQKDFLSQLLLTKNYTVAT